MSERLIPEAELRAALERDEFFSPYKPSDEMQLDIAEAKLLLGFPASNDQLPAEMFVVLVRRLVKLERYVCASVTPAPAHGPGCDGGCWR